MAPGARNWGARWTRFFEDDDIVQHYLPLHELQDAEPAILETLTHSGLAEVSMLDIGVGAGRTTRHFAPRARDYVGIDVSHAMIEACRSRFRGPDWAHASFETCDVRDMGMLEDGRFDFVLFSWNGLDMVGGEEDRLSALGEIHRVCAPGGSFAFSSHNLGSLRRRFSRRSVRTPVLRALNPSPSDLDGMDSALIADARRRFRPMRNFYIRPAEQFRQLEAAGFRDPMALTAAGQEVCDDALEQLNNDWLYYLCRK